MKSMEPNASKWKVLFLMNSKKVSLPNEKYGTKRFQMKSTFFNELKKSIPSKWKVWNQTLPNEKYFF